MKAPLHVQFTPIQFGAFGGEITIDSNDPVNPAQKVGIAGSATKKN